MKRSPLLITALFFAPENTLASADSCIRLGVDVIATDKPEQLVRHDRK